MKIDTPGDVPGLTSQQKEELALSRLREAGTRGLTVDELVDPGDDRLLTNQGAAQQTLELLEEGGYAVRHKGRWRAVESSRFRRGIYRRLQRKLGEVLIEPPPGHGQRVRRLSIRERDRGGARDGDIVLVRRIVGKPEAAPHPLGAVTRVVARRRRRLVARIEDRGSGPPELRSFDPRLRHDARDLEIKPGQLKKHAGQWVVVEVTEKKSGDLVGRITEVLGSLDEPGVDVEVVVHHHEIPSVFPAEVEEEARLAAAEEIGQHADSGPVRSNFTRLPTVTIDGVSAKDFDDAITVLERPKGGFRLLVHIADVAHYVRVGSALDLEARRRGTSVYFPERVIPMLPSMLSDDVCSLRPGEERFAMTVEMDFDQRGRQISERFFNSLIRSDHRMTYAEVAGFLQGETTDFSRALDPELASMLELAADLMKRLGAHRAKRGALSFDRGSVAERIIGPDLKEMRRERVSSESHRLIEEFMLVTNETVARVLAQREERQRGDELTPTPGVHLYRFHPTPSLSDLAESWTQLLPDQPPLEETEDLSAALAEVVERCKELGRESLAEQLLMRSLTRAQYSTQSLGHFALALEHYCHFTSPIRRYPDLVMHRRLKELIAEKRAKRRGRDMAARIAGEAGFSVRSATQLAADLSAAEQRAETAERDLTKWRVVRHLAARLETSASHESAQKGKSARQSQPSRKRQRGKVGKSHRSQGTARRTGQPLVLHGVVTGALDFGLFVQLEGYGVDALLPVDALDDDWYELSRSGLEFVGRSSGRRFQLGDRLKLEVREVDVERRRINVALAS